MRCLTELSRSIAISASNCKKYCPPSLKTVKFVLTQLDINLTCADPRLMRRILRAQLAAGGHLSVL